MTGIFFVFAALITSISSYMLAKTVLHAKSPHDPLAYVTLSSLLGGVYALIFYSIFSFHRNDFLILLNPSFLFLLFLDVLFWALGSIFYYPGYKYLPVSESTVMGTLEGFFAFLFGFVIFKTESLQFFHVIGGILILLSVLLVSKAGKRWKWDNHTAAFLLGIAIFGLASVIDNVIISRNHFSSAFFFEIFNFSLTGIFFLSIFPPVRREFRKLIKQARVVRTVILTSFSSIISFFLIYSAYKKGVTASQANLILSSQTIFIVLFGMLLFKEKGSLKKKLLSALIAGVGVYLLS